MNQRLLALAFQEDSQMWIILIVVLVILFFIVAIVAIGLAIFFIMRKRSKDQKATAQSDMSLSAAAYAGMSQPETAPPVYEPAAVPPIVETSDAAYEAPSPAYESPAPVYESPAPVYESPAPVYEDSPQAASSHDTAPFDPSRTVAIVRENTVPISYGTIKFVSGVLMGQEFQIDPEGSYIGRESTLSQIVVADPRISKRHLWIGVRDGIVKIVDHDSRNGTFINDPKSERITEAALNSGDTVIMGESDVARFEFQAG
jgi:predicted component of type VI protein secretion system